ncbi:MAG: branched-chain amino acid transaminase [Acidimicrobiaceae bacterium]|nr:branched-chain amino acid transaminase [Acidimicrobiaceae bacterium]
MSFSHTKSIWMNGKLLPFAEAKIHVLTHSLHYGTAVFEGIRVYETDNGPAVFRLTDHIQRLHNSAKILDMPMPYSVSELVEACKLVVRDNDLKSGYMRPIAFYGFGSMGLATTECKTDIAIAVWPWGAYLGEDALTKGIRMKVSSWARHVPNVMPPASKTTGNYVNSTLAKMEALRAGYDEAIMLNTNGLVSECSGENIFAGLGDELVVPPGSASSLSGITENSIMALSADLGFKTRVGELARSDLYIADEVLVCGTAAEVCAVNSIDDRSLPCPGPRTQAIGEAYNDLVHGRNERYEKWNEYVYE